VPQWTLKGRNALIIITRMNALTPIEPVIKQTINALVDRFGERNVKRAEAELTVAGEATKATRIDVDVVAEKVRQYVFGLQAGGGTYLMILQELPDNGGATTEEAKVLMGLLNKELVIKR
jgi:hypothetical protein